MDVFLDRRLPDYFRSHSWQSIQHDPVAASAAFADFLGQRFGVIHGFSLAELDRDFLSDLNFPQTWDFKKLQVDSLLGHGASGAKKALLNDGFHGDKAAYNHFVTQVQLLRRMCLQILSAILPIKPTQVRLVTRFSETRMENLHYDQDAESDNHEAFRLYINLDRSPRIWATSYQMTELVQLGGRRLVSDIDERSPGEMILKRVMSRAFGGWNQRATERLAPRHMVYVDPGDVFFVDGRCVSHQVMTGHRVLSLYARIPHGSPRLAPTFATKLRQALMVAKQVPPGGETAIVNYFEPRQVTAAPQLREEWGSVFGETQTGRIRRFDDSGAVENRMGTAE